MQYMLLIYDDETGMAAIPEDAMTALLGAYGAYTAAIRESGVLIHSARLRPTATATTVSVVAGETRVLDGPYAETKEQLGGYYLIEVADLDAALSWAARCPGAAHGRIEVRPVWPM
jgi:hypothetical protein